MKWLVIALLVLAGCTEPEAASGTGVGTAPGPLDAAPLSLAAPVWDVGQWWTYDLGDGVRVTWVVTAAADGYEVYVNDPEFAFADAALDDVSTIGPMTIDLAGKQGDTLVEFFDWPLTQNKTWTFTWDGKPFTATASVTEGAAVIEAVADDEIRHYGYSNASEWFSFISASDLNGTEQWRVDLQNAGRNYGGTYARYEVGDRLAHSMNGSPRSTVSVLAVPAGFTEMWYDARFVCGAGPGQLQYVLLPPGPNEEGLVFSETCPGDSVETGTFPAIEGTWRAAVTASGISGHIVVIPRTLTEATV